MNKKTQRVGLLLLGALAVRIVLIFLFPNFRFPDEFWYAEIAQNLLAGNGYTMAGTGIQRFAICKAPALPFVLAAWGTLFPLTPGSIKVVDALLNWGGVVFLSLAAWRISRSAWPALLTALFAGFHPAVLFLGVTNYPQNGQLFFLGLLVYILARRKGNSFREILGDGVLLGLGALFVPTHIFLVPALLVFYAASSWKLFLKDESAQKRPRRAGWLGRNLLKSTLALFFGGLIAVSPWVIRNAVVERAFIPFTATSGQQFYTGFNDQAKMNSGTRINPSEQMMLELRAAQTGPEFEAVHWKYAWAWITENKLAAARLWGLKFFNWFRWNNGSLNTGAAGVSGSDWVQRGCSLFVLLVCAAGCAAWPKEKRWVWFVSVLMLANAFGHAFFISRYRYRLPFEPLLLMAGLCGLFLRGRFFAAKNSCKK